MFLTEDNIWSYLLDKNIVDTATLVEGRTIIAPASTRNIIFKILNAAKEANYLLKQASANDPRLLQLSANEIRAYDFISANSRLAELRASTPRLVRQDQDNHILIIEYLPNTVPLNEYHYFHHHFETEIAIRQAEILANCHSDLSGRNNTDDTDTIDHNDTPSFAQELPWVFKIMDWAPEQGFPGDPLRIRLMTTIQGYPELTTMIRKMRDEWCRTCLIHGDIKLTNFIIGLDNPQLWLIDWEAADIGDPCWDIAGLFQAYVSFWIFGLEENSPFDKEKMQRHLSIFYRHYATQRSLTEKARDNMRTKSIRYTGVRLLQTAIEALQNAADIQKPHIQCIQAAFNMLANPNTAELDLFGPKTQQQ